jgi:chromate transporter
MPRSDIGSEPAAARPARPSLGALFRVFLTAGAISFGGGVVAYLREFLVSRRNWLDDDDFLSALEISETLPGLNSVNLAVIVGDNLRGIAGAAAAVAGVLLPGAIVVMTLGVLWEERRHNPDVTAFLVGIASAAVGLLLVVTLQLGRRQLTRLPDIAIVIATFVAVSIYRVPLAIVLLTVGALSILLYRPRRSDAAGKLATSAPEGAAKFVREHLPFHRGPRHGRLRT